MLPAACSVHAPRLAGHVRACMAYHSQRADSRMEAAPATTRQQLWRLLHSRAHLSERATSQKCVPPAVLLRQASSRSASSSSGSRCWLLLVKGVLRLSLGCPVPLRTGG